MGDKRVIEAIGIGCTAVDIKDDTQIKQFTFHAIYHVPELKANLLSVPQLVCMGHELTFNQKLCVISQNDQRIAEG